MKNCRKQPKYYFYNYLKTAGVKKTRTIILGGLYRAGLWTCQAQPHKIYFLNVSHLKNHLAFANEPFSFWSDETKFKILRWVFQLKERNKILEEEEEAVLSFGGDGVGIVFLYKRNRDLCKSLWYNEKSQFLWNIGYQLESVF